MLLSFIDWAILVAVLAITLSTVLDTDIMDGAGNYAVSVPGNTNIRIQVLAQLVQTTGGARDAASNR